MIDHKTTLNRHHRIQNRTKTNNRSRLKTVWNILLSLFEVVIQTWCVDSSGMGELCIPFWVTLILTLTSDLISRFFVSGAYLLNYKKLSSYVSYA